MKQKIGFFIFLLGLAVYTSLLSSAHAEGIYIDNSDGTVNDVVSITASPSTPKFLMWTRNANPAGKKLSYSESLQYIKDMNSGKHENYGYKDWRIPTKGEMDHHLGLEYSLIPPFKTGRGLPSGHPFTNLQTDSSYWSQPLFGKLNIFLLFSDKHYLWPVRLRKTGI